MRKLISVVFTIERNRHFGQECIDHLKQNGFIDPILKIYPAAAKGKWKVHRSIMRSHHDIIRWFAESYDTKTHDIMVCEDDCEFVESNSARLVHHQLDVLHANYNWSLCLLGQIACGPMFQTNHDRLNRTTFPVTAHCYVFNGEKTKAYLKWIDDRWWTSPFMTEFWLFVPPWEKFAIFPGIATQNRQIKCIGYFPYLRDVPVIKFIRFSECVMYWMPFVILFILLFVCLWKCK